MKPLFVSLIFFIFFLRCNFLFAQEEVYDFELPEIRSQAAVLMDATTGAVLYNKNGDIPIPPASLAKLMTIHIALTEVAAGNATLDEVVTLPRESWAASQPPRSSLMFLARGQIVTLRELLLGLAIPSGNDAAVAVALRFAPTVKEFAERMNQEARSFGLSATHFVEPSGVSEYNITTAREFTIFCREYLRLHPETLTDYHSVMEFAYPKAHNVGEQYRSRPGTITQYNHNTFLKSFEGTDGLKTGYIDEAGHNIAITAERDQTRLIAVILGAPAVFQGSRIRDEDGMRLLTWGFEHFKTLRPVLDIVLPRIQIWKGKENTAELMSGAIPIFTTFMERGEQLHWEIELADPIIAPIPQGSTVGALVLYDTIGELQRIPLLTAHEIERGGFFKRLWDTIRLFFHALKAKNKKNETALQRTNNQFTLV